MRRRSGGVHLIEAKARYSDGRSRLASDQRMSAVASFMLAKSVPLKT